MKSYFFLILLLIVATPAAAQTNAPLYPWSATMKVVDEKSNPIFGANAEIGYYTNSKSVEARGLTDTNGLFETSHTALSSMVQISLKADKEGYYPTLVRRELGPQYNYSDSFFTQTLVLKKIGHPVPMYCKWIQSWPGKTDGTNGYDLMAGDWVAPKGKGVNTDILFSRKFSKKTKTDYDYVLTVSFPKAGDGIQEFSVQDVEKGSALRSPHEAPAEGYKPELLRINAHHPGQPSISDYDENRNYFFRVRTVLDQSGNVVSTLYGKIYGDPEQMNFHYFLNPTANDRNIEFDPHQNLLRNMNSFEQVTQP